jgi:G3E family GTPase
MINQAPLIVHDLSDLGLDAELLAEEGTDLNQGKFTDGVAALHGQHADEHLQASLKNTLSEIAPHSPPLILCESTGAARPWPLIQALTQDDRFFLRHFIVTVDALNLHRDFQDGRILTGESTEIHDPALMHAAGVLAEQIAFASVIILTKTDTIPKSTIEEQVKALQKMQPRASLGLSAQAGLLLNQLDSIPAPKIDILEQRAKQFGLHEASSTVDNVEAITLKDPRPFHPERLYEVCQNMLSTGLYRSKGFLWLASRPGHALLWQQSGSQISFELRGLWRAELVKNQDGKLNEEEVTHLTAQLENQHPDFGDRHNELTLIGLKDARESFYHALEHALCTEEEVSAWKNGQTFNDPWPKTLRQAQ